MLVAAEYLGLQEATNLDILEANRIAWPNPSMWKGTSIAENRPVPTYRPGDGAESHGHSPRRQSMATTNMGGPSFSTPIHQLTTPSGPPGLINNPAFNQSLPLFSQFTTPVIGGTPMPVSYSDAAIKWYAGLNKSAYNMRAARKSSTDTSMPDFGTVPDYSSSGSGYNTVMLDPSNVPTAVMTEEDFAPAHVKAPTNTPIVGPMDGSYRKYLTLFCHQANPLTPSKLLVFRSTCRTRQFRAILRRP